MKTGFINGYPNKPVKKGYSYHGVDRDCLIQPDPGPFEDFPTGPPLGEWELFREGILYHSAMKKIHYSYGNYLPSDDLDQCAVKFWDGKARYYFCEVMYIFGLNPPYPAFVYNNGLTCGWSGFGGGATYRHCAWFQKLWAASNLLFWVYRPLTGSWYKIWRSKDGNFPGYYPVPPGCDYD